MSVSKEGIELYRRKTLNMGEGGEEEQEEGGWRV